MKRVTDKAERNLDSHEDPEKSEHGPHGTSDDESGLYTTFDNYPMLGT